MNSDELPFGKSADTDRQTRQAIDKAMEPYKNSLLDLEWDFLQVGHTTIRGYLCAMLSRVWAEQSDFTFKRAFGYNHWQSDLLKPLIAAGAIEAVPLDHPEREKALLDQRARLDELIVSLIPMMANGSPATQSS